MKVSTAEVHEVASEAVQLAVLGVGSIVLVAALAFAMLGGGAGFATSGPIETASKWAVACLAGTALALFFVSAKPRPDRFEVSASKEGLRWGKRRRLSSSSIRQLLVLPAGDRWVLEASGRMTLYRLYFDTLDEAEEIAGALLGKERLPAALTRVRQKASYATFVSTIFLWILVYGAICALPQLPIAGVLLLGIFLPPAIWVSLRALPAQVVVSEDKVHTFHPLSFASYEKEAIADLRVADDDCLEIAFHDGGSLLLPDLVNHHRDGHLREGPSSPAERLAVAFGQRGLEA